MDESTFWNSIWLLIASVLMFGLATIGSCTGAQPQNCSRDAAIDSSQRLSIGIFSE